MSGLESLFLRSSSSAPRLRVVAVVDGPRLGRPEAAALKQIGSSNFAALQAVVEPPTQRSSVRRAALATLSFSLLETWDRTTHPDWRVLVEPVDCSDLLARVTAIPAKQDDSGQMTFPAETIDTLRDLRPDVILHCASGPVAEVLAPLAQFGVWSIHLAESNQPRPSAPYFREVNEGSLLSTVALLMHGGPLGGLHVLTQARVATEHSLFRGKNCVRPILTALTFVIRKLHELHQRGRDRFAAGLEAVQPPRNKVSPPPNNRDMVRFLVPRTRQRIGNLFHAPPQRFRWRLALRSSPGRKLTDEGTHTNLSSFSWLFPPQGGYFADPFLIRRHDKLWLFCEELSYSEGKGALSCMEISPEGQLSEPVRVLTRPYHISYPAVFESDGEVFMIPETVQSGKVELYHAVSFPYSWVKVRDLMAIRAADCTPLFHEGRHWLFVPAIDPAESSTQLLLFSAPRLDGDWTLHPASPLSLDARYARSGGAIVVRGGKLFRPSQDCAPFYGRQLNIHQITRLDPEGYEERLVQTISPQTWPGLRGVHTYATCGDIEVIDGQQ
jgi:hypothetical protein